MAHVAKYYGKFFVSLANKEIDLDSDTLKVMLCTSSYTPDQDAHQYKSSVTSEITGTGYTAGGLALTSVVVSYTGATNVLALSAANTQWTGATFTARNAVLYDSTPASDSVRPLIGYILFDADISVTGSTFTITWDSSGIATITVS
ncbi:hypothetical protein GFY24_00760 [Nocardia sp. SYP-A9097]|uniref:hypothetical protein n=1 Tax=Nocardia sp. SYP-A9097 TaxID=2663237 RepID=UPI00129AACE8|nr:hypothetical protein [Nocardia sp. SYP-A9097]MRH86008.1 hypothetical protein [Nocardia sp. SYP-A9097]